MIDSEVSDLLRVTWVALMFYYFPAGLWRHQPGFSICKSLCNWRSWKVSG